MILVPCEQGGTMFPIPLKQGGTTTLVPLKQGGAAIPVPLKHALINSLQEEDPPGELCQINTCSRHLTLIWNA